ncbi:MAG: hypothetical protein WCT31_02485 [Candidatus Micrarchaeia archaeon]|jgi:hypothetical protein
MTQKIGKAIAFFDCRASKKRIEGELSTIREFAQVPPMVELRLYKGPEKVTEKGMKGLAASAKEDDIRYAMVAMFPGRGNEAAANELAAVLNQAYQSPLYREGEPFKGYIFYRTRNGFVNR